MFDEGDEPHLPHIIELLLDSDTLDDFLHSLALAAMNHAPNADGCGLTLQFEGRPMTVTSAGTSALALDEKQYGLGDGPCLQALRDNLEIDVTDMREEQRWGEYPSLAASSGARSSLSLPIAPRTDIAGALNLYSPLPHGFDSCNRRALRDLASQATGAIQLARRTPASPQAAHDIQQALRHRAVFNQAIGFVMAKERCTNEQAFVTLRHTAQSRDVKLRDLCAEMIGENGGPPPPPAPTDPRD
ncbi:GAF and ANTAR domain-containing protein [Streptomyces sp. NPDC087903]|uniref:GAF and ANTAR domain-containing protein n=1 Tax=Streptomyces sp. NPDC087903 TaxID=3365819 RepID=UPI00380FD3B8